MVQPRGPPSFTFAADLEREQKNVESQASQVEKDASEKTSRQPLGWRLNVLVAASFAGFFLSLLDTTIVAVALPSIADQFADFERSTWVINAYLITYMGV